MASPATIDDLLSHGLACPLCKAGLPALTAAASALDCASCGATFRRATHSFDFTPPPAFRDTTPLWQAWDQVQANGLAGYTADPERNLSVGVRQDCASFAAFSRCRGLVLDVGCGPQEWPAYFRPGPDVSYVGIDPYADASPARFLRFIGLAEFLPFAAAAFDHVLFATTLDHFVDPAAALVEAVRVLSPGGEIAVWLGEKDAAAPKPKVSTEWYLKLEQPALADDMFHIKRMNTAEFLSLATLAGLNVLDHEHQPIDRYRANHFYRLRPRG